MVSEELVSVHMFADKEQLIFEDGKKITNKIETKRGVNTIVK